MSIRARVWTAVAGATIVVAVLVWTGRFSRNHRQVQAHARPAAPAHGTVAAQAAPRLDSNAGTASHASLAPAAKAIVSREEDYHLREQSIQRLAGTLAPADLQALYAFLRQPGPDDAGQPAQVLKNELMDRLCELQPPPAGLRELLTAIYQDRSQNIVLRDYAVQHLSAYCRQVNAAVGLDASRQKEATLLVRQTLWEATAETDSSIAGTALLGLSQMNHSDWTTAEQQRLDKLALKSAGDTGASELTRITALQICARLGIADALPVAWTAAQLAGSKTEQISAIAALGALGGAGQQDFLTGLLQGDDERVKPAAQAALHQIRERLQRNSRPKSI